MLNIGFHFIQPNLRARFKKFLRVSKLALYIPGLCDSLGPAMFNVSILFSSIHAAIISGDIFFDRSIMRNGLCTNLTYSIVKIVPSVTLIGVSGTNINVPSESLIFNFVLSSNVADVVSCSIYFVGMVVPNSANLPFGHQPP